jgi:peptidoglycan/xylan/chitin deacetylase (PgdA/CDA1 family)
MIWIKRYAAPMCRLCLPRRALLAVPLVAPWAAPTQAADALVEPRMKLANPPSDGLAVVLTLDACPGAFDERIAQALIENRIPATIFVTELWMRWNPTGLALLLGHRDLFAIENHGSRHIPPILGRGTIYGIPVAGDLDTVRREVTGGAAAVEVATGETPHWYRAAAGHYSPSVIPDIQQLGFGIAGYSLNADAGASLPARSVAGRIAKATNGEVIVAHINQPNRPSGLGVVAGVKELQRRGASFLRLDRLAPADLVGV